MKSFRNFIKEEVLPSVQVADGGLDIEKPAVRAAINAAIAGVVSQPAVTPYVVYNRLSKLLAQYHIILPKKFLEGDKGVEVFELRQFGHKMGMTDGGEFVKEVPSTHYLFLQYGIITPFGITYAKPVVGGMFKVMARIVDKEELDRLLDMAEITMKEEAEVRQLAAKASAPKEPMHDITSDEKKKGNKEAVADSEKGLSEELSHGARELTLHADNDQQLHRSSHQPIIKNLQRKHAKGTYDHEKATKLWKYHADRAAKSYEKQHGGKFSVADRKAAAAHFADSARSEHGFGTTKEETQIDELSKDTLRSYVAKRGSQLGSMKYGPDRPRKPLTGRQQKNAVIGIKRAMKEEELDEGQVTGPRSFKGSADRKRKAVQMALGRKHKDHPDWNPRTNPQYSALKLGRKLQKQGVNEEEQIDEGYASIGHSFDWAGDVNRKARFYGKKPKATTTKNDEKDDTYKNSKQGDSKVKFAKTMKEGRMPASIIRHKQKLANMTPEEKAKKFAGKSEEQLKSMARRHGYGKNSTEYSKHKKLEEKAPPGAKFERMVKHIKAGYAKDGLTKKEKSIAYATAWKAKKRQDEETKFDPSTEIPKNT